MFFTRGQHCLVGAMFFPLFFDSIYIYYTSFLLKHCLLRRVGIPHSQDCCCSQDRQPSACRSSHLVSARFWCKRFVQTTMKIKTGDRRHIRHSNRWLAVAFPSFFYQPSGRDAWAGWVCSIYTGDWLTMTYLEALWWYMFVNWTNLGQKSRVTEVNTEAVATALVLLFLGLITQADQSAPSPSA